MLTLNQPLGTNYRADPQDIMNTKRALSRLGHYPIPPHRGIDDWTDDAMFEGIRAFQKDNGLKVDGFMRPGGPTESAINDKIENNGAPRDSDEQTAAAGQPCSKCWTPAGWKRTGPTTAIDSNNQPRNCVKKLFGPHGGCGWD